MSRKIVVRGMAAGLLTLALLSDAAAQESVQPPYPEPELVVPAGTVIPIILSAYLNSRSSQVGDTFYADTAYPIWIQQRLVIPQGSLVRGTVTQVERPGRIKGKGRIAVRLDDVLLPNGVMRPLSAVFKGIHGPGEEKMDRRTETVEMGGSTGADVGTVASNAGTGAIIGAISGGGKGAGIGAGAGSAVGLATVLFTRGRELVLHPGTQFDIELKQPLRFSYAEVDFSPQELNSARTRRQAQPRYQQDRNQRPSVPFRRGFPFPWP